MGNSHGNAYKGNHNVVARVGCERVYSQSLVYSQDIRWVVLGTNYGSATPIIQIYKILLNICLNSGDIER